uniref:NAD-dependent epimerase/dehydratase domain-containing protein n=1 Tax=Hordeum vulgare subsp. vulgare TaxID=112509 RepID=A0A8I6YSQ8_HORVV
MEYASENGLDFISIIPTLVVATFLSAGIPPSLVTALALITGNETHYSILKQVQLVHLDDLCDAMTFLFEHREANCRYIYSHDDTIHVLARMLQDRFPEYDIPKKFAGVDDNLQPIHLSSKKPERRAWGLEVAWWWMEEEVEGHAMTVAAAGAVAAMLIY